MMGGMRMCWTTKIGRLGMMMVEEREDSLHVVLLHNREVGAVDGHQNLVQGPDGDGDNEAHQEQDAGLGDVAGDVRQALLLHHCGRHLVPP